MRDGVDTWRYVTPNGVCHAVVVHHDPWYADRPWLAYTPYTEGNGRFSSPARAKRYATQLLRDLLAATEALR